MNTANSNENNIGHCGDCKWFGARMGRYHDLCRRRAPIAPPILTLSHNPEVQGIWPAVTKDDHCGEWEQYIDPHTAEEEA